MTANDEAGRRGAFPAYVLLFATLYAGFGVIRPSCPRFCRRGGCGRRTSGLRWR
jgi:hypothetical protein